MWSPDSSRIALEDVDPGSTAAADEARLAIYDLASGTKRVLESSVSPVKRGAAVWTITSNPEHTWYYEGWSWSPDGRSLLLLKDHRTRPIVVDIATDTATELPWETDSFPSWQPIVEFAAQADRKPPAHGLCLSRTLDDSTSGDPRLARGGAGSRPAQPVIEAAVVYGRDNGWVLATEDLRRGLACGCSASCGRKEG